MCLIIIFPNYFFSAFSHALIIYYTIIYGECKARFPASCILKTSISVGDGENMGLKHDIWLKRIAERTDLSSQLIHITKGREINGTFVDGVEIILNILRERRLYGTDTEQGFIIGDRKAVCFQDVPIYSLCQNIYADEMYQQQNPDSKVRYIGVGLMLPKTYVYRKGGRPVIYDKKDDAKRYLDKNVWWRIVNLDLEDNNSIIDWSHEREWRVAESIDFELEYATALLSCPNAYSLFIEKCKQKEYEGILEGIRGIVNIGSVFF